MRIKGAKQVHYDSGPNMTPLVDVVMVILIFLMLCGSFAGASHYLMSSMPISASGGGSADLKGEDPFKKKLIEIQVNGRWNTDAFSARAGQIERTQNDMEKLTDDLARLRAQYLQEGKKDEDLQVVINPNKDCKYKSLIQVYQAAVAAKFTQIGFKQSNRQ